MATAAVQARLGQGHQQGQARLAEALARLLVAQWRVSVRAPGVGTDEFLERALRLIRAQYAASGRLATSYYTQARRFAAPGAPLFVPEVPDLKEDAVVASLTAAGFAFLSDALARGEDLDGALAKAGDSAARAGARQTLSGGRRAIQRGVAADQTAFGYYWQTRQDGKQPCYWCAMLASRGVILKPNGDVARWRPVFKEDSWPVEETYEDGTLKVKAHDKCGCHLVPVWTRQPDLPEDIVDLYQTWRTVTRGLSGDEAMLAWRQNWEGRLNEQVAS